MFEENDDVVEAECEAYACETCPVADVLAELDDDPQNAEAWAIFHRTVTRFTVDTHTTGWVLTHELTEKSSDEILDLFARLTLLYDVLHPPPEPK